MKIRQVLAWLLPPACCAAQQELVEAGQRLAQQGRLQEAAAVLERGRKLRPDDHAAGLVLGSVLRASRRPAEATALLENVMSVQPSARVALQYAYALQELAEATGQSRLLKNSSNSTLPIINVPEPPKSDGRNASTPD